MFREKNRHATAAMPHTAVPRDAPLAIDTANMYRAAGADGIEAADLAALADPLVRAHQALTERTRAGLDSEYACLTLPAHMPAQLPQILEAAQTIRRFRDVLVVGIGGSSLGAKAVYRALKPVFPRPGDPSLHFIENIDPPYLDALLAHLAPETTAVIAISKSGGTIETVGQYLCLREWLEKHLGKARARQRQWLITDPAQGWMRALAAREDIPTLPVPPKVGGRYSVLTAVGLLPLAGAGIDVAALLRGAADNAARCAAADLEQNPALELAALYYLLDIRRGKRISIMMPYVNPLDLFGDWYCQLWAESLGKRREGAEPAGTLPVRALGTVDQHSQLQLYLESRRDKMFTFLTLRHGERGRAVPLPEADRAAFPYLEHRSLGEVLHAEFLATRDVITRAGHPNLTIGLPALDAHVLGQLIDLYQRVTVYAGLLYGVNPLDQPAVEAGKKLAVQYLSERAGGR